MPYSGYCPTLDTEDKVSLPHTHGWLPYGDGVCPLCHLPFQKTARDASDLQLQQEVMNRQGAANA